MSLRRYGAVLCSAGLLASAAACGPQVVESADAGNARETSVSSTGKSEAVSASSSSGGPTGGSSSSSSSSGSGGIGSSTGSAPGTTTGSSSSGTTTAAVSSTTGGTGTTGQTLGGTTGAASSSTGGASSTGTSTGTSTGGLPAKRGIWIWQFDALGYASWADVAAAVSAQGAGFVLIKATDGDAPEVLGSGAPQLTAAAISAFTSLGIAVYAWSYVYPDDDTAAALAVIAGFATLPGLSGMVLDVEAEFETATNASTTATDICTGMRASLSAGAFLGYTSFGIPSDHPSFPYAAFDAACGDGFFPQVYWTLFEVSWSTAWGQCQQDVATLGLTAPLWPVGCNYVQDASGNVSGTAATADLDAFFAAVGPTASLWEYPQSSWPQVASFTQQLAQLSW